MWLKMELGEFCRAASGYSIRVPNALLQRLGLMLDTVSVRPLSDRIPLVSLPGHLCPLKKTTYNILLSSYKKENVGIRLTPRLFIRKMLKKWDTRHGSSILLFTPCRRLPLYQATQLKPNPGFKPPSHIPVGRWAPQKPRWWVMSVQPGELSLLKVARWRSRGSHITGDVNQSISGFLFLPRSPFVSPPMFSVKAEIRKVCLGALCIRGAASHFRLDHGWQVKENKNCLYRRDRTKTVLFF